MVVLASREHLCIHGKVSKSPNKTAEWYVVDFPQNLFSKSKKLLEMEACKFQTNKTKLARSTHIRPNGKLDVWDIEDFVKLGHDLKGT